MLGSKNKKGCDQLSYLLLIYAHFLGDYPLQGKYLAETKGKNIISLIAHSVIWTGTVSIAGFLIGFQVTFVDVIFLFVVHGIIDYLKANQLWFFRKLSPEGLGLVVDQLLHGVQILIFALSNY